VRLPYPYEEQTVFHRGKRTVPVYDETSPVIAISSIHAVYSKMPVVSVLKVRKQFRKLFFGESGQGTETLFAVLIILIFHSAKAIRASDMQNQIHIDSIKKMGCK
jgi:hypothetical protein